MVVVDLPANLASLEEFRVWCRSDRYPEQGRFDWIAGDLEFDLLPEELNTHGSPKSAIAGDLGVLVEDPGRGQVYIGRARLSSPAANLSSEPDVLVLLYESVESARARLIPRSGSSPGRFVEIEDSADLVVECLSDASTSRDARLRRCYHAAGVSEYWIVDARSPEISLEVLLHRPGKYEPSPADDEGFRRSEILGRRVRLVRLPERAGLVRYRLENRP